TLGGDNRTFSVKRVAKRVDDTAQKLVADRNAQETPRAANFLALGDFEVVAEDDDADGILFEVKRQADRAVRELDHLLGHDAGKTVDAGDTVADLEDAANFADIDLGLELFDFLLND